MCTAGLPSEGEVFGRLRSQPSAERRADDHDADLIAEIEPTAEVCELAAFPNGRCAWLLLDSFTSCTFVIPSPLKTHSSMRLMTPTLRHPE